MIGVSAGSSDYRVAARALPGVVELVDDPQSAIVAVPGAGDWVSGAAGALEGGAAAVIVEDPGPVPDADIARLQFRAADIPIILDRQYLRADHVPSAEFDRSRVAAALVEIAAGGRHAFAALSAGVGWIRELLAEPVELCAEEGTVGGTLLLLRGRERGVTGTVLLTRLADADAGVRLRVDALGEERWAYEVDAVAHTSLATVAREEGQTSLPQRFEQRARLSLRRAVKALAEGTVVTDLADFRADLEITNAGARTPSRTPNT